MRKWCRQVLRMLKARRASNGGTTAPCLPTYSVANHIRGSTSRAELAAAARFIAKADLRLRSRRLMPTRYAVHRARAATRHDTVNRQTVEALTGRCGRRLPEGTTSDGHGLLKFHSSLLQSASTEGKRQPIAIRYRTPGDEHCTALLRRRSESLWLAVAGDRERGFVAELHVCRPLPRAPRIAASSPAPRKLSERFWRAGQRSGTW